MLKFDDICQCVQISNVQDTIELPFAGVSLTKISWIEHREIEDTWWYLQISFL